MRYVGQVIQKIAIQNIIWLFRTSGASFATLEAIFAIKVAIASYCSLFQSIPTLNGMIKPLLRVCAALSCCLMASASVQAQNIYLVTPTGGTTATPHTTVSASDWASASNLQAALVAANASSSNSEIWVMSGTYKPAIAARDSAFVITKNGLKLYGGFAGTETSAAQRDATANLTYLSGEINSQSTNTDNSYHVMIMLPLNGSISSNTVVDGFTITSGYNIGASASTTVPYLSGQFIFNGYGAGLLMSINNDGTGLYSASTTYNSCSPVISHCTFSQNNSGNSGAEPFT